MISVKPKTHQSRADHIASPVVSKENVFDGDGDGNATALHDSSHAPEAESGSRNRVMWLQGVAFLLGLGLLIYLVHRVGVDPIFAALKQIGFGFFLLISISGARHAVRTLAMRQSVPREHRTFGFPQAFAARIAGEAITFLTFAGPLLGEATKAALLKRRVPLAQGVQAIVVDNLLYNLSVALLIIGGAIVMLFSYQLPTVVQVVLWSIAASAATVLAIVAFAVRRRVMPLTWLIERIGTLAARGLPPFVSLSNVFTKRRRGIEDLETHVYDFYRARRGSFFLMLGLDFLAHATSVLEVYAVLSMLGFEARLAPAFVIESLTKVINFAFGFVPATIGVYEGGTEIILRALGYAAAAGVTLAIVRKASIVWWTTIGLMILSSRVAPAFARRLAARHPRIQKVMDNLVISNITHRPARTLTTILGIGLGVLLIVFTVGLAHGILRERGRREGSTGAELMIRASGSLGFGGSTGLLPLSEDDAAQIANIEGVRLAVPMAQATVNTDSGFGVRLVDGIEFDSYSRLARLNITEGRAFSTSADVAIVDTQWAIERQSTAPIVGSKLTLFERPFTIVGIYEPPGGGRVKISLRTMQEQLGGEGRASTILVSCVNPIEQEQVAARIQERFPDYQILLTRDLPELYAAGTPALNVFISIVTAIAATISTLVILLAMYTTVIERTRQIGILKALGMSRGRIAWIIEQEALLVSVLGVITGLVLVFVARFIVMRMTTLTVDIEPRWLLIALAIGLLGGTLGALYPAWRAARQDAVDALSYE